MVGTIQDIDERKSKAQELDQAKDDFLSLASHQLRTPLSAIKWVLETMLTEPESFTPRQQVKLNDLVTSNDRLIKLVNYLLSVARIESGKLVANKKLTDFKELAYNVSRLSNNIVNKHKNITIIAPPNLPKISCDPILFSETLGNLLSNAINYSDTDSKEITIKIEEQKDDYVVSVHNVGYIDMSTQLKIRKFEKFVRGDNAAKIQPSGSGLGLYITNKMLEISGGKLWFQSKAKHGTTFYFTINKK
jgi:K+-sensing histidine kinase KdpD